MRPLRQIPENLQYKHIAKLNSSFIPQKNNDWKCECQVCNQGVYPPKVQKMIRIQQKILDYFNVTTLSAIIDIFEEMKEREIQFKAKRKSMKEQRKNQIENLQTQLQLSENKINMLESTVKSLHSENDKMILIIESLRNENVQMCEKNVYDQFNRPKFRPSACIDCNLINENQNLKTLVRNLENENQKLKNDNKNLENEIQKLTIDDQKKENDSEKLKVEYDKYQKLQIDNSNYIKEIDQLKIDNQNLLIEIQNQKIAGNNSILENQRLQLELSKIREQLDKLGKSENNMQRPEASQHAQIDSPNEYYQEIDQKLAKVQELEQKIVKYQKQLEILRLNNKTLETENKALSISLNHHTVAKGIIKDLQRQNFKLEIEVEQLKMKNFKSPFKPDLTTRPIQTSILEEKMIDIGILTSFVEDNVEDKSSTLKEKYRHEKERRKQLAALLSRIIKMFNSKCTQFVNDFSTVMDSQNARIMNITKLIKS